MHDEATMKSNFSAPGARTPGILGKLLAFMLSTALLVLTFMFSLAALAVVAVAGTVFAGWLWWKTRTLRKQMREASPRSYQSGNIIDGEAIRTADTPTSGRLLG